MDEKNAGNVLASNTPAEIVSPAKKPRKPHGLYYVLEGPQLMAVIKAGKGKHVRTVSAGVNAYVERNGITPPTGAQKSAYDRWDETRAYNLIRKYKKSVESQLKEGKREFAKAEDSADQEKWQTFIVKGERLLGMLNGFRTEKRGKKTFVADVNSLIDDLDTIQQTPETFDDLVAAMEEA